MNRFERLALASVIVVSLFLFWGNAALIFDFYRRQVPEGMLPVGLAGWAVSTYGPIAVAVIFWRLAKQVRAPWVLHLLLLPCMLILMRIGNDVMLSTIKDPDFDSTMDAPLMPGILLFLIAAGGYFGALIARVSAKSGEQADLG